MIWLLAFAPIVITLVALGYLALAVWRKARGTMRTAGELREHVDTLAGEAAALADRLAAMEADPRLADLRGA